MTVHYGLQAGIPVFREFGKRAIKLREPAGRDLGERAACVEAWKRFTFSQPLPHGQGSPTSPISYTSIRILSKFRVWMGSRRAELLYRAALRACVLTSGDPSGHGLPWLHNVH